MCARKSLTESARHVLISRTSFLYRFSRAIVQLPPPSKKTNRNKIGEPGMRRSFKNELFCNSGAKSGKRERKKKEWRDVNEINAPVPKREIPRIRRMSAKRCFLESRLTLPSTPVAETRAVATRRPLSRGYPPTWRPLAAPFLPMPP